MRAFTSIITLATAAALIAPASAQSACKYPSQANITAVFDHLAANDYAGFFARMQPDVNWTVEGTHPLAGQYHSVTSFVEGTLARLSKAFAGPTSTTLYNVVGGCDEEWSVTEFNAKADLKSGGKFDNNYAWSTRWNTEGNITQVRAYLDSELVARTVVEHEVPFSKYSDVRS